MISYVASMFAQRPMADTLKLNIPSVRDSLGLLDTLSSLGAQDTLPAVLSKRNSVSISPDAFTSKVKYDAKDSTYVNSVENSATLYGEAIVTYESITLEADVIEINFDSKIVTAKGTYDSLRNEWIGLPVFADKGQEYEAFEMRYNFDTGKGFIKKVATIQNDLYVKGTEAKFIRADVQDTTAADVIYSKDAIFTVCDHDEPHFGIRSSKQKVVANKLAIVGPSNLEIMNIPTPLWLPFGFFPFPSEKSTGLIFPKDYTTDARLGFGLNGVGWYFPINDQINLQLTSDIYTRGSFRLKSQMDYKKRYKYAGRFKLEYHNLKEENSLGGFSRSPSFIFFLSHNQDASAHPSRSIGGSINIQTNNASNTNYNDINNVQSSTLSSNFSYRESFPSKPFNLSLAFSHSQNTYTRDMTINFPTFDFKTQTLYPFKRKEAVGGQKWYEKVSLKYDFQAKATVTTTDTTLFTRQTLEDIRYGGRHKVASSVSFKLLKYFNLNPRVNYQELWYMKTADKIFDNTIVVTENTEKDPETGEEVVVSRDTSFGTVIDTFNVGFKAARSLNAGIDMDTKLFGTLLFKKGFLRGIRHQMEPSIGFNFTPDYANELWGYTDFVQEDTRYPDQIDTFSVFEGGIYSAPSVTAGRRMALTYSISNFLEAKIFSKRDSTTKNVRVLKRLSLNGNYNFAAEKFKWSLIKLDGNMDLIKGISNLRFNATWDPYDYILDEEGERVEVSMWDSQRKVARFYNGSFTVNTTLSWRQIKDLFRKEEETGNRTNDSAEVSNGIWRLAENFRLSHNFVYTWDNRIGQDTSFINSHTISIVGELPLSPHWKVRVNSFGYDFKNERVTYPSFNVNRDIHCWELGASWYPDREIVSFYLRVHPGSVFDFLNLPYKQGNTAFGGF